MFRLLFVSTVALFVCVTGAYAQQAERARAAFTVFRHVCLSGADSSALTELLTSDGWVRTTPSALPRPSSRSNIQLADQSPPEALIFEYPDQPPWLYVQLAAPEVGAEYAPCAVFAAGVSRTDLAALLYPGADEEWRREEFDAMPIAIGGVGVIPYSVSASRIALGNRHVEQRTFAYFALAGTQAD